MVAGTSCRHAGKVLRHAGNFLYGYSTGAVKLADMPASCRHLNRERIALERFLLAGMRWISKFAGSGFAGMPWPSLHSIRGDFRFYVDIERSEEAIEV